MTEYGAPITTSETYCRDTASEAPHSVLIPGEPGLVGGRSGPGEPAGVGQHGWGQWTKGTPRLLRPWLPAHSPGRPAH